MSKFGYYLSGVLETLQENKVQNLEDDFLVLVHNKLNKNYNDEIEICFNDILESQAFTDGTISVNKVKEKLDKMLEKELNFNLDNSRYDKPNHVNEPRMKC
jgi:hypothetical protein